MSEEATSCKSCANTFTGSYCNVCGEKVIDQNDRRLSIFVGDLISALTFADSKFWRTIKAITLSPGKLSLDYIEGRRVGYMKPISIFFLANLLYFIFPLFGTFNTSLGTQMSSHRSFADGMVTKELVNRGISLQEYEKTYNNKTTELSKLLLILMAVILSIFLWLTHFGKNKLITDHFILSLEFMSFVLFYPILIQSFLLLLLRKIGIPIGGEIVITLLALIICFYFLVKAERIFFNHSGIKQIIYSLIGLIFFSITAFIYRAILFFVTFWSL